MTEQVISDAIDKDRVEELARRSQIPNVYCGALLSGFLSRREVALRIASLYSHIWIYARQPDRRVVLLEPSHLGETLRQVGASGGSLGAEDRSAHVDPSLKFGPTQFS